jgi:hypothetical protein
MCIDSLALNHQTVKAAHPMTRIEELLEKLRDYRVVSNIDLKSGVHQVCMRAEDITKTTSVTCYCAYKFLVMLFDLAHSPAVLYLTIIDVLGVPMS